MIKGFDSHGFPMASNNMETKNSFKAVLKEDKMVHQLRDPMEIEGQSSPQSDEGKEDEGSALVCH